MELVPTLDTPRLILRVWRPEDEAPFASMNADAEVMRHFPALLSADESRALIQRFEASFHEEGFGMWAVERKNDGAFLGFTGLLRPRFQAPFTPCVEIGWRIAKAHWGRGYAPEAAVEALRYASQALGLPEVLSWTAQSNQASIRVMEKIGLVLHPLARFEHPLLPEGHRLRPHVLYRTPASIDPGPAPVAH